MFLLSSVGCWLSIVGSGVDVDIRLCLSIVMFVVGCRVSLSVVIVGTWLSVVGCWLLIVCIDCASVFPLSVPSSDWRNDGPCVHRQCGPDLHHG